MIAKKKWVGVGGTKQMCVERRMGKPVVAAARETAAEGDSPPLPTATRMSLPTPMSSRSSVHESVSCMVPFTGSSKPGKANYLWRWKSE